MMRGWRRRVRALLALFILLAPFYIVTSNTTLHRLLLKPVEKVAGLDIQFKKSSLSFFYWDFRIHDLQLSNREKTFAFESPLIRISVSPLSLIKGQLIVSKFEVDSPHLRILKKSEEKKRPAAEALKDFFVNYEHSFLLQNIVVKRAWVRSLRIERPEEAPVTADDLQLSLEPNLNQSIRIRLALKGLSQGRAPLEYLKIDLVLERNGGEVRSFELSHEGTELSLAANWKGDLEKGKLSADGKVFSEKNLTEPVTFQIESEIEKQSARIGKLAAQMGSGKLEGSGTFNLLSKGYDIDFQAQEVPLELIFQKLDSLVLSPARGIGEVKGKAKGTLPEIAIDAIAAIHHLHHNKIYAHEAAGSIGLHWPLLHFKAAVFPGEGEDQAGEVTGGVLFQGHSPSEKIRARLDKLDLSFSQASLSKLLPDLNLSGILTGELHLQGAEKDGESSAKGTGEAEVRGGAIGVITVESLQTRLKLEPGGIMLFENTLLQLTNLDPTLLPKPIRLEGTGDSLLFSGNPLPNLRFKGKYDYQTKEIALEQLVVHSEKGNFQAEGSYREALDLRLKGPLQISWLQIFRTVFGESSGWSQMDLKINGTPEDPRINGVVSFQEALLELRGLRETVSDLSGKIIFQDKKVAPDLTGRLDNGNFTLKGTTIFEKLRPNSFDLRLSGVGLPLQYSNDLSLEINGDLRLTGAASDPLLAGKIEIVDGRYTKRFEAHKLLLKPIARLVEGSRAKKQPRVRLNLDVKSSGDLQIKNNIAEIFLSCDLQIKGNSHNPQILGAFSLTEGHFQYLTANFTLTEGRVEYTDPDHPEPYLIIHGERDLPPDYVVYLKIEGYLNNLHLDFSSTPSRDRDDILSLLAFGMTRDELQRQTGVGTKLGLDLALEEAARPVTGILSKATGLDVRIKPTAEGPYSPSRITLESEVTDRLSLEFRSDLAPETAERTIQANYYLTDNFLLKGLRTRTASTEPQYHFNLSLRFQIR